MWLSLSLCIYCQVRRWARSVPFILWPGDSGHWRRCGPATEATEFSATYSHVFELVKNFEGELRDRLRRGARAPSCSSVAPLATLGDLAERPDTWASLATIYSIKVEGEAITVPATMRDKLETWLQHDQSLLATAERQRVIHITNKVSGETTHYNPLRAERPGSKVVQNMELINKIISESQPNCDFCNAKIFTAEEVWGRVETASCVTAANMFRISGPTTGLLLSRQHSLLQLRDEDHAGQLDCARRWFRTVHARDPRLVAATLIMDTLGRAGASQTHPHMQMWMGEEFEGQLLSLQRQGAEYRRQHRSDYWADLVSLHTSLGLGLVRGEVAVVAPLTSHKEHELMVISKEVDADFVTVYTAIMRMYASMQLWCRSLALAWPWTPDLDMPVILRVGSRGACDSPVADVSSLELYSIYSVNSDPVTTITNLKRVLAEMETTGSKMKSEEEW